MVVIRVFLVEGYQGVNAILVGTLPVLEIDWRALVLEANITCAPLAVGAGEVVDFGTSWGLEAGLGDFTGRSSALLRSLFAENLAWDYDRARAERGEALGTLETAAAATLFRLQVRHGGLEAVGAGEALYGGRDAVLAARELAVPTEEELP